MMDKPNNNNMNRPKPQMVHFSEKDRATLGEINEKVDYLSDLFTRRLKDDRQKSEMIETITKQAEFNYVEPFIHDLILVLDRLEKTEDEFSQSIYEEISDILFRYGVQRITTDNGFDPSIHKVIKTIESEDDDSADEIAEVLRSGYIFGGKTIRPTEIVLKIAEKET